MKRANDADRPLVPGELLRARRLEAYYRVLNKDGDFLSALSELFQMAAHRPFSTTESILTDIEPSERLKPVLKAFAERWRLPRQSFAQDLWHSFFLHCAGGLPVMLTVGPRSWMGPTGAMIRPAQPIPFEYDPTHHGRGWLKKQTDEAVARLRQDILAQARELERRARDAGFDAIPPRHRNNDDLKRSARRLYLRAVRRRSWQAIALEEWPPGTRPPVETGAVRDSVTRWAEDLGIPLPSGE